MRSLKEAWELNVACYLIELPGPGSDGTVVVIVPLMEGGGGAGMEREGEGGVSFTSSSADS